MTPEQNVGMTPEQIVATLAEGWNTGDGTRWASVFSEDAVFVDVLGRVMRGRAVIAEELQKLFDTIYQGSRLTTRVEATWALGNGFVLFHSTSTVDVSTGPRAGVTDAIQTNLVRDGLVVAFQNTIRTEIAGFAGQDPDLATQRPLDWQTAEDS